MCMGRGKGHSSPKSSEYVCPVIHHWEREESGRGRSQCVHGESVMLSLTD